MKPEFKFDVEVDGEIKDFFNNLLKKDSDESLLKRASDLIKNYMENSK